MAEDRDVSVSRIQGVQSGSGNTQHNYYHGSPGPNFVTTLSPGKAVARLLQMPHDDALSVIATAPVDDMAEVLKVMLETDRARATTFLADIHPRKARELITLILDELRREGSGAGFQHYANKQDLELADGLRKIRALCGWVWTPLTRLPLPGIPICPRCKALYDSLPSS